MSYLHEQDILNNIKSTLIDVRGQSESNKSSHFQLKYLSVLIHTYSQATGVTVFFPHSHKIYFLNYYLRGAQK